MKIPVSAFGASAPTSASASWTATFPAHHTVKAARPFPNGETGVVMVTDHVNKTAALVKISAAGATVWGPSNYGAAHGEATDMQVSADGTLMAMTGHKACVGDPKSLCGKLSKVSAADGALLWSKEYASCNVPNECGTPYIKNECWGLQALADGGYVLACGTGIENCDGMSGTILTQCMAGETMPNPPLLVADKRPGAYPRYAAVWQSMVVRTDASGDEVWRRVDAFRRPGQAAVGEAGFTNPQGSAASEYVVKALDGGLAFIQDEASGIGLMKLAAPPVAPPPPDMSCDNDGSIAAMAASNGRPEITTCAQAAPFCKADAFVSAQVSAAVTSMCTFTCTGSCTPPGRASLLAMLGAGRRSRSQKTNGDALLPN